MRIRISFAKTAAMRFTGHLDLHHTWERTFRRSRLPLAYSQGFNPHPRLNLAAALPLGFTSQAELLDAWLDGDLPLAEVSAALQPALPPGLQILDIQPVEAQAPALQTEVEASEYILTLLDACPDLEIHRAALLQAGSLPRRRRNKDYDLRPLVLRLDLLPEDERGHQRLFTRLSARESATGRPEEVLEVLGYPPSSARVHRTALLFRGQSPTPEAPIP